MSVVITDQDPSVEPEVTLEVEPEMSAEAPEADPVEDPEAPAPEYEPNFSYKVYDEEKEMDEWARQYIKTAEEEEKFKKLFEAAGGFNVLKERHTELKGQMDQYKDIEKQYTEQSQIVGDILGMVDKKDYNNFFKQMGIAEDEILKYALDIVKYREMSPDQRQVIDQQRQVQEQNYQLERQTNQFQQQLQEQAFQTRSIMLDQELSKPDISSFVQNFETVTGRKFRDEVIKEGQLAWTAEGVDLTPEQAVKKVMERNAFLNNFNQQAVPQTPQTPPQKQVVVQQQPTIPNVQASGSSPAKKQINSLDDLKKLRASME